MKNPNILGKYEVLMKQYLRSILDMSVRVIASVSRFTRRLSGLKQSAHELDLCRLGHRFPPEAEGDGREGGGGDWGRVGCVHRSPPL